MSLQEALANCNSYDKDIPWRRIAKQHGVVRSTFTRTYRRETQPHQHKIIAQQRLTPQQEEELVSTM
ncbi:uncharacterized protein M421DRAFT_418933, partial [Didymella exigua CBS 183.55]